MTLALVIASTNKHKRKALSLMLKAINPDIEILSKNIPVSKISPELKKTAKGNAIEKAVFYGDYFGKNVICEDDSLLLNFKEMFLHRNKGLYQSPKEIYDYWSELLSHKGVIKGRLIKAFAFNNNNKIMASQLSVKVQLILPKNKITKFKYNPLNYFIVPEGYTTCIAEFDDEMLLRFRQPQIELLSCLLNNI